MGVSNKSYFKELKKVLSRIGIKNKKINSAYFLGETHRSEAVDIILNTVDIKKYELLDIKNNPSFDINSDCHKLKKCDAIFAIRVMPFLTQKEQFYKMIDAISTGGFMVFDIILAGGEVYRHSWKLVNECLCDRASLDIISLCFYPTETPKKYLYSLFYCIKRSTIGWKHYEQVILQQANG
jgi:hypothetical protein